MSKDYVLSAACAKARDKCIILQALARLALDKHDNVEYDRTLALDALDALDRLLENDYPKDKSLPEYERFAKLDVE